MADSFKFELVSPERLLISVDAKSVRVPGDDGDFLVLPDHSPMMSTLRPGIVVINGVDGEKSFFVRGGFADAGPSSLTILAEIAMPVEELKSDALTDQIAAIKAEAEGSKDDLMTRHCNEAISCLETLH